VRLEGLVKLKNPMTSWGNQTRYLPASSIEPQPTMLPRVFADNRSYKNCILWIHMNGKGKVVPVQAVEALGFAKVEAPTFSDIRLTVGGEVVSPTRRPLFTPRKIPGARFC
jgi:hypothetical protein